LNKLSQKATPVKSSVVRLTRSSKIFKAIIHGIEEKKGEKIISLDLRKIHEAVADFFIICQASNPNQLKAIADSVEDEVKKACGEPPYKHEGRVAQQWILVDYVTIVVHIMLPDPRKFYQLEEMWSDAPMMEHVTEAPAPAKKAAVKKAAIKKKSAKK
jgi:ribosome-associated protein